MTRDTAKYESLTQVRFNDGVLWPRKLKDLLSEKVKREIRIPGKPHSPIEDCHGFVLYGPKKVGKGNGLQNQEDTWNDESRVQQQQQAE